ncbi:unnamed protein product [Rotaria sordida]|uniref:Uncharacterized protein n=1 Tax=Rotaria sordida TaxID=392033 RepID=A0A818RC46_9BILA|nr:unnamed protein product [Rotaria sordida]CAF3651410.1 unnamed protein product [Rotaria sordida]
MQSNIIVRFTMAVCLIFLLFTTVLSESSLSDSKSKSNIRVVRSAFSEPDDDLSRFCHYLCTNNQFLAKRAYLKGFVHGRSPNEDAEQQNNDDDLLEERFVHGKRFVHG